MNNPFKHKPLATFCLLAGLLVLPAASVLAQNPGPNPGEAPFADHRGGMGGDREMGPGMRGEGGMHGGFRIAPPGLWWKNPMLVQQIGITPDQQKKMDDILQQSRLQLIDLKANVERQELLLHPMLDANPPDTSKVLAQIDKLAQARADLEKSNAKMLLGIRTVLTPDQWTKLQQQEHNHRGMMGNRGPDGGRGMRGPGGQQHQGTPGQQPQPGSADHSELKPAPDNAPGTAAQE